MSNFAAFLSSQTTDLTPETTSKLADPRAFMVSATPAVLGGAAVVGSALVAYAVEEAGDK